MEYLTFIIGHIIGIVVAAIPIGIYIYLDEKKFNKLQKEKQDAWDRVFEDYERRLRNE